MKRLKQINKERAEANRRLEQAKQELASLPMRRGNRARIQQLQVNIGALKIELVHLDLQLKERQAFLERFAHEAVRRKKHDGRLKRRAQIFK